MYAHSLFLVNAYCPPFESTKIHLGNACRVSLGVLINEPGSVLHMTLLLTLTAQRVTQWELH